jgi:hypothetical protein
MQQTRSTGSNLEEKSTPTILIAPLIAVRLESFGNHGHREAKHSGNSTGNELALLVFILNGGLTY